jgi:predicted ATPase
MKEAVEAYDGVVSRTQGDGIMAFFGAPRPHEDHAVRACLAALSMQDAVRSLGDSQLKIRVGLHTGEVVVHVVNNTLYQTYDAVGANVHLASRMEQLAEGGGIVLSANTFAACKHLVKAKSLGLQAVRGLSVPIEIFHLVGIRHAPASELFRSRVHLSRLTGRDEVLSVLENELATAIKGDGRIVGVVGEAGIGKSRLCFEFTENCRRKGIRVYETRALAYGRATPLQPVLELFRDYFGIRPGEGAEEARRRVIRILQDLPAVNEAAALILDFLGLTDPAFPVPKLDPVTRKMRLLDLVRSVARSGSRERVAVVLIEDLHWVDAASEEFVEALAEAVVGTTTLLLLNFRPGLAADWMQSSHYRQIGLSPLEVTNAGELVRDLLGEDDSLSIVCRNVAERAHGNPFFLEELVHSLIERGDLEGSRGAYRSLGGIDTIPLPLTVEAVLAARIDRLEEPAKHVLQSAAVIGREVPLTILERVTDLRSADIAKALWQLRQAELLDQLAASEEVVHSFRHPLIQEVAYGSLLNERRRKLHRAVAQAIEAQSGVSPDEQASLLAYHLEQAGEPLQAAQANVRVAMWVGANDAGQALRSWRKVRELVSTLPASEAADRLRMQACGQIMNFGWREGISAEEAEGYFEEAKNLALATGNMRANALIHAAYGRIIASSGSADDYVAKIREAEALGKSSNDPSVQVTLKATLCHALRLAGRMSEALIVNIEATKSVQDIAFADRQVLGFDVELWLTVMRGQILVNLGRFNEARPYLDRLLQLASDRGDLTHHLASVAYVDLAWAEGDVRLAEHHAARAFAIALKSGSPYVRVYAQACRGLSHVVAGRLGAAIEDLAEALSFARRRNAGLEIEARILADLSNAYRLNGDLGGAWGAATEALEVARARSARVPACLAHIVRAHVLSATIEGIDQAADEVSEAQALMEATGAKLYQPLIQALKRTHPARRSARGIGAARRR